MNVLDKFDRLANGYSEQEYADPKGYAERRAEKVIVALGPALHAGESVLDLGCGDGIMAAPLGRYGLRYAGVNTSEGMVDAARARNPGLPFAVARSEEQRRRSRSTRRSACARSTTRRTASGLLPPRAPYTSRKFVFDLRQAENPVEPVLADLRAAGFAQDRGAPVLHAAAAQALPGIVVARSSSLSSGPAARGGVSLRAGRVFCSASG